jgi:hypothetical protein
MRWLLGLVIAAGCGTKGTPAVENAPAKKPAAAAKNAPLVWSWSALPRPEIDIESLRPDFHDELRWPLSAMNHPSLEPRFPIADQLATTGITWEEMCTRGVHRRVVASQREMLTYLHAWCDVQKRDVDAACANLAPLLGSTTRGLTAAVRQDLANILVATGDADKAERCLSRHNIRDVETLDLLAASYAEIGSIADASAINRLAIDADVRATHETKCLRLVRQIATAGDDLQAIATETLKQLATESKTPDPTCVRLHHKVACAQDHTQCRAYYKEAQLTYAEEELVEAYYTWPSSGLSAGGWMQYIGKITRTLPIPGATEMVVAALEAATRRSCLREIANAAAHAIGMIRSFRTQAGFEARIEWLEHVCDLSESPPEIVVPPPPP